MAWKQLFDVRMPCFLSLATPVRHNNLQVVLLNRKPIFQVSETTGLGVI